jgi:hypothetical protein
LLTKINEDPHRLKAEPDTTINRTGTVSFGTTWPLNPANGDLFLKIDTKPNKLYKWNRRKWVEVDRKSEDALALDMDYIDWLINQLRKKHVDFYELTDSEKEQIKKRVNG